MKKTSLLIALLLAIFAVNAQDIIVMKNGDLVQSKVMEITQTEIKYKKFSNPDGPLYTIDKATVLSINYENGEKEMITSSQPQAETTATTVPTPAVDYSISPEENEKLKQKYRLDVSLTEERIAKLQKKKKIGDADAFYCQLDFTSDAILADKNVEIEFQAQRCKFGTASERLLSSAYNNTGYNRGLQITIKNKTDKVIYIDLANSFFIRGSLAEPYYIPTATSSTNGGSTGASVNLGGITNALGVGGAVGALANAVTVGGSKSSATTNVTYSQRIISIPPMSSKKLDPMLIVTPETIEAYDLKALPLTYFSTYGFKITKFQHSSLNMKEDDVITMSETDSKFKITSFITYSFDETLQQVYSVKTGLYANKLIATNSYGCIDFNDSTWLDELTENAAKALFFTALFD